MEKQIVAIFVAQPPHRYPLVGISPEDCGYGKNVDGRPAPRESIKFSQTGRYEATSEDIAEILRNHKGNVAKGGDIFFEVPPEVVRHGQSLSGEVSASYPPEGLSDFDKENLARMAKMDGSSVPPKARTGAIELMEWAVERFRVSNFSIPSADKRVSIIKGRLSELCDLLNESGIKAE